MATTVIISKFQVEDYTMAPTASETDLSGQWQSRTDQTISTFTQSGAAGTVARTGGEEFHYVVSGAVFTVTINGQSIEGTINADGTEIVFGGAMNDLWVKVVEPVTDISGCWQSIPGANNGAPVMTFTQVSAVGSATINGFNAFNYAVLGDSFEVTLGSATMTGTITDGTIVFHQSETENGDVWGQVTCPDATM